MSAAIQKLLGPNVVGAGTFSLNISILGKGNG
jgi:hypothetical protein